MALTRVPVKLLERSYEIVIGRLSPADAAATLAAWAAGRSPVVIADDIVAGLHPPPDLPGAVVEHFPAGEASKSLTQAERLYARLAAARIGRDGVVITFGGGVAGDLGGFVAGTWMRGIPVIQCPTTLEAAIDAAIGGKTAVNHPAGKNLVGVFHQPLGVMVNLAWLETLSARDWSAGLAESVKHGLIADPAFVDWHGQHAAALTARDDDALLTELIARNCAIKAAIVAADEREAGVRMHLNYGHTAGHAIELLLGYALRHGECVGLGMRVAHALAVARGLLGADDAAQLERLLAALGLPVRLPGRLEAEAVWRACQSDKKNLGGRVRFVLLDGVGRPVVVDDVSADELEAALAAIAPPG